MDKNYDKNLVADNVHIDREDMIWHDVTDGVFDIYGFDRKDGDVLTQRIPEKIAEKINVGVHGMRSYATGGRIRFCTDSSFIAIKVLYGKGEIPTVSGLSLTYGLDLYELNNNNKEVFKKEFRHPGEFDMKIFESLFEENPSREMKKYTLNLPVYSEVNKLYIGLERGCNLLSGEKYANSDPVVFYGSSITNGMAASRPGNTYESFISQKYNLDYVNLGFSGNALGETKMAEYLSSKKMCAFVCDYDHNAPNVEHLEKTHCNFYKTFRQKQPNTPYIMITKPDFFTNPPENAKRRSVIYKTYEIAKANGDNNVYFIDGETLFKGEFLESCTVDGCHPNDIGFLRMATVIGDVIAKVLKLN